LSISPPHAPIHPTQPRRYLGMQRGRRQQSVVRSAASPLPFLRGMLVIADLTSCQHTSFLHSAHINRDDAGDSFFLASSRMCRRHAMGSIASKADCGFWGSGFRPCRQWLGAGLVLSNLAFISLGRSSDHGAWHGVAHRGTHTTDWAADDASILQYVCISQALKEIIITKMPPPPNGMAAQNRFLGINNVC
jgi:hypothetical protein